MLRPLKTAVKAIIPDATTQSLRRARVSYAQHPYLLAKGWYRSAGTLTSIDGNGKPIPWITYPAQMMLERVISPDYKVFEYGCGNSSLWWAERVAEICSVENDSEWAAEIAARAPANLTVAHKPADASYQPDPDGLLSTFLRTPDEETDYPYSHACFHGCVSKPFGAYALEVCRFGKGYFDIIVVDGMARVLTAWIAMHYVKPTGFIVFDNADRSQYNRAYRFLSEAGFKRIDFYGVGPITPEETCTSIFAKSFDWLAGNVDIPSSQETALV